nr:hypothetical protein [Tanacetum cinerariifolium]
MSRVKCYNFKKEGHFAKDCKKAKVKDYEYYKTKMLLAKKDKDEQVLLAEDQAWMESSSDSDQEISVNMVFMAQIEKVLSDSEASSSSADEKISEVSYYLSESESESELETSEYYYNSTNYAPVSTSSSNDKTANLSNATVYALLANQPNRSQLVHEDLEQIHEDDIEEIDLKWQLALLSMRAISYYQRSGKKITINRSDTASYDKSKVECFNCHKMGHFARECRSPMNQDNMSKNQDNSRKTMNVEESFSNAMVAIDGAGSQIYDNSRKGMGFASYSVVAPPPTGLFAPPNIDLSNSGLEEFQQPEFEGYGLKVNKSVCEKSSNEVKKTPDALIIKDWVSDCDEDESNVRDSKSVCVDTSNDIKKALDAPIIEDWVSDSDEDEYEEMVLKSKNVQHTPEQANQPRKGLGASVLIGLASLTGVAALDELCLAALIGKFDGKADEGFLVGYFINSKTFRVFNNRTSKVEERLHVNFFENKPNVAGSRPEWTNWKREVTDQEYILLPFLNTSSYVPLSSEEAESSPKDDASKKTTIQPACDEEDALEDQTKMINLEDTCIFDDLPHGKRATGTKWVLRNKKDQRGIVVRNKARLVAQGHRQEEGIDYDEVFAPVARIDAIRLFFAYASFMDFIVYQMSVKSAFLYGTIEYENGFRRGTIDKTLFIKKIKNDILLVQVYVVDTIFGSTKKSSSTEFELIMHKRFQMSSMRELTFFLGFQVKQRKDGIFLSQDKYVCDILKKFVFSSVKTTSTPMETHKPLLKDADGTDIHVHIYRSMIRSLMYLTSSRPEIMFDVYACSRFQVQPKASHMHAVKSLFRYLKGQPTLGLWYPKDSPLELIAYSRNDYTGSSLDRKSTTGGCQFLGYRLISWQCKKQTVVANSTTKQMVINSPCLTDKKELAIPGKTTTNKEFLNPLMAGSLPKTISVKVSAASTNLVLLA